MLKNKVESNGRKARQQADQFGYLFSNTCSSRAFPGGSNGKESSCNAEDPGSTPGQEDLLEKEMTAHSNSLAWRIPWMEEPSGLDSRVAESDTTEQLTL